MSLANTSKCWKAGVAGAVALVALSLASGLQPAYAATYQILHHFRGPVDGANSIETPVIDSRGAIYGTARYGGGYGLGTLWKWQSGMFTVLHKFSGAADDGGSPSGALLADNLGNLYGTAGGGAFNQGIVYQWDTEHGFKILHDFDGVNGAEPFDGVIRDADGNLYGTTKYGGWDPLSAPGTRPCSASACGTLFKIDATGAFTPLHAFIGSDGYQPRRLVRKGDFLYGGTAYVSPIFKYDLTSGTFSIAHVSLAPGTDGYAYLGGLVRDSAGNIYGTAAHGARSLGGIYKIDTADVYTYLHGFTNTDGAHPDGSVVLDDAARKLYGTTSGRTIRGEVGPEPGLMRFGSVWELDLDTNTLNTLHVFGDMDGNGIADDDCNGDGTIDECQEGVLPVSGVVRDAAGNLYGITQYGGAYGNGVLFKVTP
jgi:uncharacterized repeat protein (TIGR03803 family)